MNDISIPSTGIPLLDTIGRTFLLVYIALTILARILPPTSRAGRIAAALSLDLRKLLSPPPPAPPDSATRKAARAATMCLALGAMALCGCTAAQAQPITSVVVAAACDLVEVLDPSLAVAAMACASAQPTVVGIIDSIIADLGPRKPEAISTHLVPVDLGALAPGGCTVLVRADLSVAFRAEVAKRTAALAKVASK